MFVFHFRAMPLRKWSPYTHSILLIAPNAITTFNTSMDYDLGQLWCLTDIRTIFLEAFFYSSTQLFVAQILSSAHKRMIDSDSIEYWHQTLEITCQWFIRLLRMSRPAAFVWGFVAAISMTYPTSKGDSRLLPKSWCNRARGIDSRKESSRIIVMKGATLM